MGCTSGITQDETGGFATGVADPSRADQLRCGTRYDECVMVCGEKIRLIGAYQVATSALVAGTTVLRLKTGAEYIKALTAQKLLRAKCQQTRLALRIHKAEHGC